MPPPHTRGGDDLLAPRFWAASPLPFGGAVCIRSGRHLGPDEPGELSGDGGDNHIAVGFAFVETPEPAAETNLGRPGPSDSVTGEAFLAAAQLDADTGAGPIRPGGLDQLGAEDGRCRHA